MIHSIISALSSYSMQRTKRTPSRTSGKQGEEADGGATCMRSLRGLALDSPTRPLRGRVLSHILFRTRYSARRRSPFHASGTLNPNAHARQGRKTGVRRRGATGALLKRPAKYLYESVGRKNPLSWSLDRKRQNTRQIISERIGKKRIKYPGMLSPIVLGKFLPCLLSQR